MNLEGIYPPIPTSFRENGDLAVDKMQENLRRLSAFDLAGFLVLGSNGELIHLTHEEKVEVYRSSREAIDKNKLMIAGTGGQSTRETITLSVTAAEAGADAVLILHPYYYKGQMTQSALVDHYHEVADVCPVPVIIYNMPANTGMDLEAAQILAIADHPNIIGVKDSGGNVAKMGAIVHSAKPGFSALAGSAGFLLPALSVGAVGGILALANIAPQKCIDIYRAFRQGDIEKAKSGQLSAIALNTAVTRGWGVPALKAAMDHLGLYGGPGRKPLQPLEESLKPKLFELLKEIPRFN
jgi:4-hydroxy-2-oxoglutarate aldolase